MTGELEIDDLDAVMRVVANWRPPPVGPRDQLALAAAAARACGLTRPPAIPAAELLERAGFEVRHVEDFRDD